MHKHHSALGLALASRPVQPVTLIRPHAARRAARFFAEKFPGRSLYAVKANPMPAVVQHLAGLVDALDVASTLEMQTALDTPMPATLVYFAGPGKTEAEIIQAVAAGVTIEMESATEAQRVIRAGETTGVRPRVAVRVNPDFLVKGSGMRMGGGPQQFGVDAEQVPEFLVSIAAADLDCAEPAALIRTLWAGGYLERVTA